MGVGGELVVSLHLEARAKQVISEFLVKERVYSHLLLPYRLKSKMIYEALRFNSMMWAKDSVYGGRAMPNSVMMAVTYWASVTSKAGL